MLSVLSRPLASYGVPGTPSTSARTSEPSARRAPSSKSAVHGACFFPEPAQVWIDLHIHVDPDLTVREAHTITRAVETALVREIGGIAEVLVHVGGAAR